MGKIQSREEAISQEIEAVYVELKDLMMLRDRANHEGGFEIDVRRKTLRLQQLLLQQSQR